MTFFLLILAFIFSFLSVGPFPFLFFVTLLFFIIHCVLSKLVDCNLFRFNLHLACVITTLFRIGRIFSDLACKLNDVCLWTRYKWNIEIINAKLVSYSNLTSTIVKQIQL